MNLRPSFQPYSGASPGGPSQAPSEMSPREKLARAKTLFRRAFAYWKVSLLILVLGCGGALAAGLAVKLIYRSECIVLFKPALRTGEQNGDENPAERTKVVGAKLKDMLTTRTHLEELIRQFGLYPKIVDSRGVVDAVEEMRLHIGFRTRDSDTFVISFENEVPETARKVTQSLADGMIAEYTNSSQSAAKQGAEFLSKQEQRSAGEVEKANRALATFLTLHPEFAIDPKTATFGPAGGGGGGQPMPMPLPKDVSPVAAGGDPQLTVLLRQKARLEAEVRNNNAGGGGAPAQAAPTGGDTIPKLTAARDQAAHVMAATAADLADKRTRLTDEHPDVVSAKVAAAAAARQLHQAELALAAAQAPPPAAGQGGGNPYESGSIDAAVQRRIAQLNASIAARQEALRRGQGGASTTVSADAGAGTAAGETNEVVQLETEWQRLLAAFHDTRAEHDDLQRRLERARLGASATEASGEDQMVVIDPAYKPLRPSKGGRTVVAVAGGVVAVVFALAYAFARVLFNDTIFDSTDVESLQLIPVLGVLPKVRAAASSNALAPSGGAEKELRRVV